MSELPAENTDGVPPPTSDVPLLRSGWSYRAWLNTGARFLALLAVFAFFAILVEDGRFYTSRNLENILRQSAVYATAALGMTMVIVSGGIDLSVGSIIALTVVVVAWVLSLEGTVVDESGETITRPLIESWPRIVPIAALVAGVAMATLMGMLNGMMVVGLRLVPFIVTLGSMGMIRGLAKGIADEKDIYPPEDTWINRLMDPTLTNPDAGWQILPLGVWLLLVTSGLAAALLRYTRSGRYIFAIGSNEEAARLCGVPVGETKVLVYAIAGFCAGLAGLMEFSFIDGIGQPTTAIAYELFVIAAVVIGGGSLMGGEGSILGSLIGALIITMLYMGGQQMGWPKWMQEIVIGAIIIAAVVLDRVRHRGT